VQVTTDDDADDEELDDLDLGGLDDEDLEAELAALEADEPVPDRG
jgi:hypothetical protein